MATSSYWIYNIESPSKMSITALIVGSVWNDQAAHYTEAEMKLTNGPSIVATGGGQWPFIRNMVYAIWQECWLDECRNIITLIKGLVSSSCNELGTFSRYVFINEHFHNDLWDIMDGTFFLYLLQCLQI